ncbi:uncharacterized protein LOC130294124 [Hyla sarda]|uniref:uncharacterized protein LOC130294124 n=1 Tax=Hyla sarda TaxID=327740 RepID=UPI0024C3F61D|nr:uncharacterized protein LOC130294124 [Hyla sarda]
MDVPDHLPTQEVGSFIHTKIKAVQPCNVTQDPVKASLPSQEIPEKPPDVQPKIKWRKKKNKKRKKRMKRRTREGVIDPPTTSEINATHSHIQNKRDQKLHKVERRRNKRTSGLINDSHTGPASWKVPKEVLIGFAILACIDQTQCLYDRSVEEGLMAKPDDDPHNGNIKVYKRSVEEGPGVTPEPHRKNKNDTFPCMESVSVSEFPIILHRDELNFTFLEPIYCPHIVPIFPSCFACFKNKSELNISCRISNEVVNIRVEHGKGYRIPDMITMDGSDCTIEDGSVMVKPNYEPPNENTNGNLEGKKEKRKETENPKDVTPSRSNGGQPYCIFLLLIPLGILCTFGIISDQVRRGLLSDQFQKTTTSSTNSTTATVVTQIAPDTWQLWA